MPEIAEAQALLAALSQSDEVKAEAARRQRLTHLQVAYGNALLQARGYGAPEMTEAFARARESASGDKDAPGRLASDYGLWVGSYVRGELPSMQAHAAAFLSDVGASPESPEATVAHRAAGMTCWFAGEYREARDHLERALALFQPGRDDDLAFRFAHDAGASAMFSLAVASWPLGEVDCAISLIDRMQTRIAGLTHIGTLAVGRMHAALFELMRGEHARVAPNVFELVRLAREHDLPMQGAFGVFLEGWATAASGAPAEGLAGMRRGVELLREQNVLYLDGLLKIALAEAEARAGDFDRAVAVLDEALATCDRLGFRAFEAELHRAQGQILLKRDAANPAPAEEAFLTAIAVAKHQATRSFELRAALALAKLYQSTARSVEAHAVLAPALEGFAPTSEMPEIAEAQALLTALAATDEVKVAAAHRQRLTQLHVARANALWAARGVGAPETTEAFARARESAYGDKDAPDRLPSDFGLWASSYIRGELPSMRAHAAAFLSDLEASPDSPEASVAHRTAGITCWFAGDYSEARDRLEKALALFQPGRDDDLAYRFGWDPGVAAMANLAAASWPLGEVDRAISLIDRMKTRVAGLTHVSTLASGKLYAAMFELMRGDHLRATPSAFELVRLAREQELPLFRAFGVFLEGWASAASGASGSGLEDMRRGVEQLREQNVLFFDGLLKIALAEAEARAGDPDRAVAILDEALATADRLGYRAFEAELHRARGDALLMRDPTALAPAEEALLTAIGVAKQQGTRSFELRAALALAKLYHSTERPAEAYDALAPALEGFAPTPTMPEIAEAKGLLTALAETDEVNAEATRWQRLMQLHVAYGNALIAARGYGAPETTEAFAKARESASGVKDAPERLSADYGLWVGSFTRGELPSMRAHSADFLNDVQARPDSPEAGVAHRVAGATCWFAGEYRKAKDHLERALAVFQPGRDDDMAFRFGQDQGISTMAYLALVLWPLGEIDRAASFMSRMLARMASLTHGNTIGLGHMFAAQFALVHGDHPRGKANSLELARIASAHDLAQFRAFGMFFEGWTRVESDLLGGLDGMRRGVDSLRAQNILIFDGLVKIALAKTEIDAGDPGRAIAVLDHALETADRLGHRTFEAELHRARGELLLNRDPNNAAAAEAFLTAIAVAKQQGTRSFELRAALALAKLYQSTARPVEAHAVLAPALEGFAPTPEMPEIAEAQALLAALVETEEMKVEEAQRQRRLHLQTSYGQAMMWAKGFAAEETRAAFSHATELTAKTDRFEDRFAAAHFQWTLAFLRGELQSARELELSFLKEAEDTGRVVEAGVARRGLALACYQAGDFLEARTHCERALEACDAECDRETQERFHDATGPVVMSVLAVTMWQVGEVDRARELIEQANRRGSELGHGPSMTHPLLWKAHLEILRGDPAAALSAAEALDDLGREHGMPFWRTDAGLSAGWARGRLHVAATGAEDLRRVLADRVHQGARYNAWFYNGLLANSRPRRWVWRAPWRASMKRSRSRNRLKIVAICPFLIFCEANSCLSSIH